MTGSPRGGEAMNFSGIEILTSPYLTEPESRVVARTWRERLGSWPWRPWVREKTIVVQVPSKQVYMLNGKAVMHPEQLRTLAALGIGGGH